MSKRGNPRRQARLRGAMERLVIYQGQAWREPADLRRIDAEIEKVQARLTPSWGDAPSASGAEA